MRNLLFMILLISIGSLSCSKDKVSVATISDCVDTISYSLQIQPMLDINCSTSGCHSSSSGAAGYILTTHSEVSSASATVYDAINHTGSSPMPLGSPKLEDSLIQQFQCWIEQGELNN